MSETGSNVGGSRQQSQPRRSQDLMPTEAVLALIARLREHRARVEELGLSAARPETEAQLLNLPRDLELEGTPEQV
eukprot:1604085-Rhodomonas_salina.1